MRTLLTVSGTIPPDLARDVADGRRPRPDYLVLAERLPADLLDVGEALRTAGAVGRAIHRLAGPDALLAWSVFARRHQYDAVFTDGEQIGIPYAILTSLTRRRPTHHMIVHLISVPKKSRLWRLLRLERRIDTAFVYASKQGDHLVQVLRVKPRDVVQTTFMVDSAFFAPTSTEPGTRPLIASAGLEFRDYDTLVAAVENLDLEVVIAAASPWSKRTTSVEETPLPPNVTITKLDLAELRHLYSRADLVVMPLHEVPFQAGITTILEAMSMAKPLICSRTSGQTDTLVDGETGCYVPPGDAAALRQAIAGLLDDRERAQALGSAARRWVVEHADIEVYAERLADEIRRRADRVEPS